MRVKFRIAGRAVAGILFVAVTQISLAGGLTMSHSPTTIVPQQQPTGILSTSGNKPVSINGANVTTGATIVSGAIIETPDKVSATITIPGHGTLQIPPKTQLSIEIDLAGNIRVKLVAGCANLHTSKGTTGEIENAQSLVGKLDGSIDGAINGCSSAPTNNDIGNGINPAIPTLIGVVDSVGLGFGLAQRGNNPSPAGL
jgi:hypothetical protein